MGRLIGSVVIGCLLVAVAGYGQTNSVGAVLDCRYSETDPDAFGACWDAATSKPDNPTPPNEPQFEPTTPEFSNKRSNQRFFTFDELVLCGSYYDAWEKERESIWQKLVADRLVDDTHINWLSMSLNRVRVGMNKCELFATIGMQAPVTRSRTSLGATEHYRYGGISAYFQDAEVYAIYE